MIIIDENKIQKLSERVKARICSHQVVCLHTHTNIIINACLAIRPGSEQTSEACFVSLLFRADSLTLVTDGSLYIQQTLKLAVIIYWFCAQQIITIATHTQNKTKQVLKYMMRVVELNPVEVIA